MNVMMLSPRSFFREILGSLSDSAVFLPNSSGVIFPCLNSEMSGHACPNSRTVGNRSSTCQPDDGQSLNLMVLRYDVGIFVLYCFEYSKVSGNQNSAAK